MSPDPLALLEVIRAARASGLEVEAARAQLLDGLCALFDCSSAVWVESEGETVVSLVRAGPNVEALREPFTLVRAPGVWWARFASRPNGSHVLGLRRGEPFTPAASALLEVLTDHEWLLSGLLDSDMISRSKNLPPRLRQTLELLLDGATEKQIAGALSLSCHTVHDYVKELYRRLHVSSRNELFAQLLRRATWIATPRFNPPTELL